VERTLGNNDPLDTGGEIRNSPYAGLEEIYVCATREAKPCAKITGGKGLPERRKLTFSSSLKLSMRCCELKGLSPSPGGPKSLSMQV